ncbi:pyridoxal phosphate phosphatase [Drosophila busckii]|uniref:pyridoxal phosphate phosphatase n=1 Tax=Drosophila busckii TaxID=30019 RepID=UPI00083EEA75|nr:pyridoxal phosphate phosphatase [Drosophila busckii]
MSSSKPRHILSLTAEERRCFVDSFSHVYSDIDGVVWNVDVIIPQASAAFVALERAGKAITFVSNNSTRTARAAVRQFAKTGLEISEDQVWHPARTLVYYLRSIQFEGPIYIIASPPFKQLVRDAGFQLIDGPDGRIEDDFESLVSRLFDVQPVRAVVFDMDLNLNAVKMQRAYLYLRQPDCQLFTCATDHKLPFIKDITILGPGHFSDILVKSTGKQGQTVGKPSRILGDMLMQQHKIEDPKRVLMIGDMLQQDIHFGHTCGFQTLLVLSGGCSLAQLEAETSPAHMPDYYADSMADFLQLLAETPAKAHF